jgi:hypothetical protein
LRFTINEYEKRSAAADKAKVRKMIRRGGQSESAKNERKAKVRKTVDE